MPTPGIPPVPVPQPWCSPNPSPKGKRDCNAEYESAKAYCDRAYPPGNEKNLCFARAYQALLQCAQDNGGLAFLEKREPTDQLSSKSHLVKLKTVSSEFDFGRKGFHARAN